MKNGETYELPLAPPALAILKSRRSNDAKSGPVFPSGSGKAYDGWNRLTMRIRKQIRQGEAPRAEAFTFHDIRRGFVSHLAERGFDVDLLDQCLSHTRKGVLGVYQRASRMAERAAALNKWASILLVEATPGNVVQLYAAR